MAQIERYVSRERLQPSGLSGISLSDAPARALQQLGGSISNVGEMLQQKKEKKEDFRVENDYKRLQLRLGEGLANAELPEDGGDGFHDQWMETTYRPAVDEFLSSVPERHRERFQTIFGEPGPNGEEGAERAAWSVKAAERERDASYDWFRNETNYTLDQYRNVISTNPEEYEALVQAGNDAIDAMGVPAEERRLKKREWEQLSMATFLDQLVEKDPTGALLTLNADPSKLAPTTKFELLSAAVEGVESGGDPNARSAVGAIGLMQVMPGTARDIAKWMGDKRFDPNWDPQQVSQYLSNPATNRKYGRFYLQKMLKDFNGDVEAALIGYHSGPGNAQKWLDAGRDPSVLGPEGRAYAGKVMDKLGGLPSSLGARPTPGDPNSVQLKFTDHAIKSATKHGSRVGEEGLAPELVQRAKTAFASIGLKEVTINSGHRNEKHNAAADGAKKSQHVHGNAMDIDVSGWSIARKTDLIRALSAAGIGGIGVGSNIIHADVGSRRSWGYPAIPKYAQAVVDEHLAGKTVPPARVAGRFASLAYDKRQAYIQQADAALTRQVTQQRTANSAERVAIRQQIDDEVARIAATGAISGTVDETKVAEVLGEDDLLKWVMRRDEARKLYLAKDGIAQMTPEEMADRVDTYKADPASPTFESDQKVEKSVLNEVERVEKLRSTRPDKAALEMPDVAAAFEKIQTGDTSPEPGDVQALVKLMLQKQEMFNVKPEARAPVPREWGLEIGESLARRIPSLANKPPEGMTRTQALTLALAKEYQSLQQAFGPYTEEVIIYSLTEFKGMDKDLAETVVGYMQAIEAGGDPLKLRAPEPALDRQQVESTSWLTRAREWVWGEDDDEIEDIPQGDAVELSPEVRLRIQRDRDNGATDEEIAAKYGPTAVPVVNEGSVTTGLPDDMVVSP